MNTTILTVFLCIGFSIIVAGLLLAIESYDTRDEYLPGDITGYLLSGILIAFGVSLIIGVIVIG